MMARSIRAQRIGSTLLAACLSAGFLAAAGLTARSALCAQAPSTPLTTWNVTIVLPPRIVAGRPATLAALGVDGKLLGVKVDVGDRRTHDGLDRPRHFQRAPHRQARSREGLGIFLATLVDPPAADPSPTISVAPVISLHDQFSICGTELSGRADGNLVKINGQLSLVSLRRPNRIVVLPGPKVEAGPATISVTTDTAQFTAKTSVVALAFEAPNPALLPGKKGDLLVRVQGSDAKLRLAVDNQTPGVLRFLRGETQEVVTTGGEEYGGDPSAGGRIGNILISRASGRRAQCGCCPPVSAGG